MHISEVVCLCDTVRASVKTSGAVKFVAAMTCVLSYTRCNTFDRCKGLFTDCDKQSASPTANINQRTMKMGHD